MKDPVDRHPPYVSDLLDAERAAPPPEREVQDRVRGRVAATLVAATTTSAATTAAAAKGVSAGVLASLATKATLIAVVVASAGATGGIALHRHQEHARSRALLATTAPATPHAASQSLAPVAVASPLVPALVAVPPAATPAEGPGSVAGPPVVERRHARTVAPPSFDDRVPSMNPPPTAEELSDENTLIEGARAALGAHDARSAVGLLERHARLHPAGQMEEEREALWVQALAAEGDGVAARRRAADFRRRFPRSIQLEVVSAALETIP